MEKFIPSTDTLHIQNYCLGFRKRGVGLDTIVWCASPAITFRPRGMQIWGATADTLLAQFQVGNQLQVLCSGDPIPARFFEAGYTFEDFIILSSLELEKNDGSMEPLDPLTLTMAGFFQAWMARDTAIEDDMSNFEKRRRIFDSATCPIGHMITIATTGPIEGLVVWGYGLHDRS